MKRYWKVKNRIITNTGKYNKKAGKERKIGKKKVTPQEDHCIQWSMYGYWGSSTLIH